MQRIRQIAKNSVVVETFYFDSKVGGKEVVVYTEYYGQQRIDNERATSEAKVVAINSMVKVDERAKKRPSNWCLTKFK